MPQIYKKPLHVATPNIPFKIFTDPWSGGITCYIVSFIFLPHKLKLRGSTKQAKTTSCPYIKHMHSLVSGITVYWIIFLYNSHDLWVQTVSSYARNSIAPQENQHNGYLD